MNYIIKHKKIIPITFMLLISTGCITGIMIESTSKNNQPSYNKVALTDNIIAIGQLDKNILNELKTPNALLFIGTINSYLITNGGDILMEISKNLNGEYIKIAQYPPYIYISNNNIWGSLTLTYSHPNDNVLSSYEIYNLNHLGFKKYGTDRVEYYKEISIKGVIAPLIKMPLNPARSLTVQRKIQFHIPPVSEVKPYFQRTIMLPLTVAADVVTSPIQVLGLIVVLISWKNP